MPRREPQAMTRQAARAAGERPGLSAEALAADLPPAAIDAANLLRELQRRLSAPAAPIDAEAMSEET